MYVYGCCCSLFTYCHAWYPASTCIKEQSEIKQYRLGKSEIALGKAYRLTILVYYQYARERVD